MEEELEMMGNVVVDLAHTLAAEQQLDALSSLPPDSHHHRELIVAGFQDTSWLNTVAAGFSFLLE